MSDKSGKVDLEAGEALFINAGQSYRLVRSEKESSSFYIIEVAGEYLAAGDESLQNKYISPVAEAESFAYCRFMPSAEEDTDEDILLQALLAAAQTAEGRDMAYELDMKSWLFTAWGSLYKKFAQPRPECKNAVIRERVKLNRMTGYLTEHCNEKLTLSAMAEACQVSTGDFCRFFKKHMEMTPFEYLQKCRIGTVWMQFWRRLLPWEILQWKMVLQEQAIFQRLSEKRWAVLLQIIGNGTVTCQMNVR